MRDGAQQQHIDRSGSQPYTSREVAAAIRARGRLKLKLPGSGLQAAGKQVADPADSTYLWSDPDSELQIAAIGPNWNADLVLRVRIHFAPEPAGTVTDAGNRSHDTLAWPAGRFATFVTRALQQINDFWDGKFWLQTPADYWGLCYPAPPAEPTHRVNVHCRLEAARAAGPADAHFTVRLAYLANPEQQGGSAFRAHSLLWPHTVLPFEFYEVPADVDPVPGVTFGPSVLPIVIPQRVVCHEFGHLLGLPHVGLTPNATWCDAQCRGAASQANSPYGWAAGAGHDRHNVMGLGSHLHAWNAFPWAKRMAAHTQGDTTMAQWRASTLRFAPTRL